MDNFSLFIISIFMILFFSAPDQSIDPYVENIDWKSYGTIKLYPTIIQDVEEITGVKFERKEAGNDKAIYGMYGGYVYKYKNSGAFGTYNNEAYTWVFWHETGHAFAKSIKPEMEKYCSMIKKADEPAVSRYAMTNCDEDFAESYAAYKLGAKVSPSRLKFIQDIDLPELKKLSIGIS